MTETCPSLQRPGKGAQRRVFRGGHTCTESQGMNRKDFCRQTGGGHRGHLSQWAEQEQRASDTKDCAHLGTIRSWSWLKC